MNKNVMHKCIACNYCTIRKYDFKKHISTQKHIEKTKLCNSCNTNATLCNSKCNTNATQNATQNISENNNYTCIYCNKTFNKHQSYYRHINYYCKDKLSHEEILEKKIERKVKKKIKEEYKLVPYKKITTTNTIYNNTYVNNNIIIKNFGAEDTSHLSDEFMYSMIRSPYKMMLPMIEKIHLDENKPENKNIKVPNIRDNTYKVYDQGRWLYKDRDTIIRDMIDAKCYEVDRFYTEKNKNNREELEKNVKKYHENTYKEFQGKYDNEDIELFSNLYRECKLALFTLKDSLNEN